MPSAETICVFGDSHIGAVKLALDGGLLPEIEGRTGFWGAPGPAFRGLRLKGDRITPDPEVRDMVARIRGDGPERLGPEDFDLFVFYSARLRLGEVLKALHDHMARHGALSEAVLRATVQAWMMSTRAYRMAKFFVEKGARLAFVPTSLPTAGVLDPEREAALYHVPAEAETTRRVLEMLERLAAEDGVPLVLQPAETITPEMMTRAEFVAGEGDEVHKSPAFAALMLRRALAHLEEGAQAA